MALFDRNNRKGGFMDEIRCDEPLYLIWKWHPSGSQVLHMRVGVHSKLRFTLSILPALFK